MTIHDNTMDYNYVTSSPTVPLGCIMVWGHMQFHMQLTFGGMGFSRRYIHGHMIIVTFQIQVTCISPYNLGGQSIPGIQQIMHVLMVIANTGHTPKLDSADDAPGNFLHVPSYGHTCS